MPRTPRPTVSPAELEMVVVLSQEVCSYLGHTYADSDAHTSALIVANWLELLYSQLIDHVASGVEGQLRLL